MPPNPPVTVINPDGTCSVTGQAEAARNRLVVDPNCRRHEYSPDQVNVLLPGGVCVARPGYAARAYHEHIVTECPQLPPPTPIPGDISGGIVNRNMGGTLPVGGPTAG